MEQRKELRLAVRMPVTVKLLGAMPQPAISGVVKDVSNRGLCLDVPLPLPGGTLVRVETGDMLMLGEVCHCEPDGDRYTAGVILKQSLSSLRELERVNRRVMGLPGRGRRNGH